MKEHLSIEDKINFVVEKSENDFLSDLYKWRENANHRAGLCGCAQCQGEAKRAESAILNEEVRLGYPTDEEEEAWRTGREIIVYNSPEQSIDKPDFPETLGHL